MGTQSTSSPEKTSGMHLKGQIHIQSDYIMSQTIIFLLWNQELLTWETDSHSFRSLSPFSVARCIPTLLSWDVSPCHPNPPPSEYLTGFPHTYPYMERHTVRVQSLIISLKWQGRGGSVGVWTPLLLSTVGFFYFLSDTKILETSWLQIITQYEVINTYLCSWGFSVKQNCVS